MNRMSSFQHQRFDESQYRSEVVSRYMDMNGYKCGLSPVRRMFCLLSLFDFLFVLIMWMIYAQLFSIGFVQTFQREVTHYEYNTSLFDLVLLGFTRSFLLLIAYALVKSDKWYIVTLTTASTTTIVIAKVFLYGANFKTGQPMSYFIIIASFILCWSEVWHFDFQVIPLELKATQKALTSSLQPPGDAYRPWYGSMPSEFDARSFYTPYPASSLEGSSSTEDEDDESAACFHDALSNVGTGSKHPRDSAYKKAGKEAVSKTLAMYNTIDGWKLDRTEEFNTKVSSRDFTGIGKVYRLETVIDMPRETLFKMFWEEVESQADWNPALTDCRVIYTIDRRTDICYSVSAEAGGGMISPRDFVNVRRCKIENGICLLCIQATTFDDYPTKKSLVRGENGPGGWVFYSCPDDPSKTQFTWFLNTKLKGWLPSSLVDQALGGALVDSVKALRKYIDRQAPLV